MLLSALPPQISLLAGLYDLMVSRSFPRVWTPPVLSRPALFGTVLLDFFCRLFPGDDVVVTRFFGSRVNCFFRCSEATRAPVFLMNLKSRELPCWARPVVCCPRVR